MKHKRVEKIKPDIKRIRRIAVPVLLCLLLLFCYTPPGKELWTYLSYTVGLTHFTANLSEEELHIHVIDVGKADAILIESPGAAILVDCGTEAEAETVLRYLSVRKITELDAVWITHGDSDHCGGLSELASEIKIAEIYQSPTGTQTAFAETASFPEAGETYNYEDFSLEVLAPLDQYEDENNNSIVFRLVYKDFSMLFCGDIEEAAEQDLLLSGADLQADVLKVAHHGSNTSTSQAFLLAVQPQYAVISVGEDRNNLPRNAVLKRLTDADVDFFRTDTDGTIVLSTDGYKIKILTENAER